MLAKFIRALEIPGIKLKGKTVVAAVSGGADSVALLALLGEASGVAGFKLAAAHVNHGLRGREADRDEALVRNLCQARSVPLKVFHGRMEKGSGLEERARTFRLKCLAKACAGFKSRLLFLAHHQDDQAETVLFNLCRGAGLEGSAGLREISPLPGAAPITCIRPLLDFSRSDLRRYLRSKKLAWREDQSNRDVEAARNFLRHKVLPLLEKKRPGSGRRLADFARRQAAFSHWARQEAEAALAQARKGPRGLDLTALSPMHPALLGFVLRLAASRLKGLEQGLDEAALERMKDLMAKGRGTCDLLKGWKARVCRLELTRPKARARFLQFFQ